MTDTAPATSAATPAARSTPVVEDVEIERIVTTAGTQVRVELDEDAVQRYADLLDDDEFSFPPVLLFRDPDDQLLLADGFHRVAACKMAGRTTIPAEVRSGSHVDAVWCAIGANRRPRRSAEVRRPPPSDQGGAHVRRW